MPYVSDLVSKLNAVTVSSYSTDDLFVLTKAYYESPVALGNIPKTFLNALKTRLLDAGTTSARDIGLLTKCINLINFGAFNVASSSTIVPSVNSTITPSASSSDLDFPTFSAVYRPNFQDAFPFSYDATTNNYPGGTITLTPFAPGSTSNFARWRNAGVPFRVGDKLSISFNGKRSAAYSPGAENYFANNSPVPNTRDYLYTVLNKIGDNTANASYTKLTVEDNLSGFVAPSYGTGYALALPVFNFLDDYGAFFTKFGLPTRFRVRMWGGGGGGASTSSYPGKGGGGGSYLEGYVTFDDIRNNPIVVTGCGGCAGDNATNSPNGGDGQPSQFAGLLAMGGRGGGYYYGAEGTGGVAAPLSSKVLFSAAGGTSRAIGGTQSCGGGAAGGPWGSGQDAIEGGGGYGAGTGQAGYTKGGDSVPYSGIWYTPALSGFVGGSGSTSTSVPAGPGAGGSYSGGIFGGGGALDNGAAGPFNNRGYGGNAGGGGGAYQAGNNYASSGGHGIVIIEWF